MTGLAFRKVHTSITTDSCSSQYLTHRKDQHCGDKEGGGNGQPVGYGSAAKMRSQFLSPVGQQVGRDHYASI